jgi:hypothetical protein
LGAIGQHTARLVYSSRSRGLEAIAQHQEGIVSNTGEVALQYLYLQTSVICRLSVGRLGYRHSPSFLIQHRHQPLLHITDHRTILPTEQEEQEFQAGRRGITVQLDGKDVPLT